jgi:hypothetical protein
MAAATDTAYLQPAIEFMQLTQMFAPRKRTGRLT